MSAGWACCPDKPADWPLLTHLLRASAGATLSWATLPVSDAAVTAVADVLRPPSSLTRVDLSGAAYIIDIVGRWVPVAPDVMCTRVS